MSDENAEKAWQEWRNREDWASNDDVYSAFMAGRASRDAEVERLQEFTARIALSHASEVDELRRNGEAQLARLRANWENECGNLEMAERKVESLRQQLAGSEHNRLLGEQKLAKTQAEQQDMEEGFRSFLGSYNRALNGLAERDAVIKRAPHDEDCSLNDWREWQDDPAPAPVCNCWKSKAPSSTLDALIRQKQAEALEEAADYVDWYVARPVGMNNTDQQYFRPWHSKWLRNLAAEYRNGADHE